MATTTTAPRQLTTSDLEAAGLTAQQVERLTDARSRYTPFQEYFSEREFRFLSLLRWQIKHGRISAG